MNVARLVLRRDHLTDRYWRATKQALAITLHDCGSPEALSRLMAEWPGEVVILDASGIIDLGEYAHGDGDLYVLGCDAAGFAGVEIPEDAYHVAVPTPGDQTLWSPTVAALVWADRGICRGL